MKFVLRGLAALVITVPVCLAQDKKPEAVPIVTEPLRPEKRTTAPLPELYQLKIKELEREAVPIQEASRKLLEAALGPLRQRMEILKIQACIEVNFSPDECVLSPDMKTVLLKPKTPNTKPAP